MIFVTQKTLMKFFSFVLLLSIMPVNAQANTIVQGVVIYQVQTSSASSTSQEFVSIYNNSAEPINITDWCLTYASASDASQTQLVCLSPPNSKTELFLKAHSSATFATIEFIQANAGLTPDATFSAGIATSAGHIKLLNNSKSIIDTVGWGAASKPEGTATNAHSNTKLLQRKVAETIGLQDTNNNATDFTNASFTPPLPTGLYEEQLVYQCPPAYPGCETSHPIINELLPNAEGSDSGKEFIELFNPTDQPIQLKNYVLKLGPAFTKSYLLPELRLEPGQYITFSDTQSGIALPNTGATIQLVSPVGDIISEATYSDLDEMVAWALIDNEWRTTYSPTSGVANVLLTNKPCKSSQTYSEETGACRTAAVASVPIPCKENQIRNIDTGRCRNIVVVTAVACKIGQIKNPDTNRCRNIVTTESAKICPTGQERNAETNRCRKVLSAVSSASVTDVPTPLVTNNVKWWVAGIGALGAGGYALFEWRREASSIVTVLKAKFFHS